VPSKLNVIIFDISGRVIRQISYSYSGTGTETLYWDGKNSSGKEVPDGIYFARISSGGIVGTIKLIKK